MATGFDVAWSTTAGNNTTADADINLRENQAPSTYNNAVRALMAALKKWRKDTRGELITTGTSTAYALTTNAGLTLLDGISIACRISVTNGASPTLNVDSTGAIAIQTIQGTAVPIGALLAGSIHTFTYYAASAAWIMHGAMGKYVGEVFEWDGDTAPPLSILNYGQELSRTTYAAYFAVVSTKHGVGNGTTTFNAADDRGRVTAGKDDMGGTSANRLTGLSGGVNGDTFGAVGGSETHALSTAQIPAHTHSITDPGHTHGITPSGAKIGTVPLKANGGSEADAYNDTLSALSINSATTGITGTNSTGSGAAHNNVQPTIIRNKCTFVGA